MSSSSLRLRVLCLHGFRTNADILETQFSASIFASMSSFVDFVYLNGPHRTQDEALVPEIIRIAFGPQDPKVGYREWYNRQGPNYVGLSESLDYLRSRTEALGPFDGIMGFSQGGSLCLYALAEQIIGNLNKALSFKFGVVVSSFAPRDTSALERGFYQYDSASDLPSKKSMLESGNVPVLCVAQKDDEVVPSDATKQACDFFGTNGTFVLNEKGGHKVPSDASSRGREQIETFFKQQHAVLQDMGGKL